MIKYAVKINFLNIFQFPKCVIFWKFKFTSVISIIVSVDIAVLLYLKHLTHVSCYVYLCLVETLAPCFCLCAAVSPWNILEQVRYCIRANIMNVLLVFLVVSWVLDHVLYNSNGEQRDPLPSPTIFLCLSVNERQVQYGSHYAWVCICMVTCVWAHMYVHVHMCACPHRGPELM